MTGIVYFFSFPDTTNSFSLQRPASFSLFLEKKHRNAIARESRSPIRVARSHGNFAIGPGPDFPLDFFRQLIQVRHLKPDHRFR